MIEISRSHPLDLHEIRSRIARGLALKDLASCTRVSQAWNDSFTPPLYNYVVLSTNGPSMESLERNKHFIRRLKIQNSAYDKSPSTSARCKVITSIMNNSTIAHLDLMGNSIEENEAQALFEALKANSTLTTLDLRENSIGDNEAQALSEALKTNSTLTTLDLSFNSIGNNGAVALSGALKTNSTLTTLNLQFNLIGPDGAIALCEAVDFNSTLTTLNLRFNLVGPVGAFAVSEVFRTRSTPL